MKTIITVRKIPLEDILSILVDMREQGIEHVNFKCEMTPTKDNIHITEYTPIPKVDQQLNYVDEELNNIKYMEYIQKIIDNHGKN